MALNVFIVAIVILALVMVLFFLFSVLLPAMKHASFSVDAPLFAASELAGEGGTRTKVDVRVTDERAVVLCGECDKNEEGVIYFDKTHSCRTVYATSLSPSNCEVMCIGAGDCAAVCPQGAIVIKKCRARRIAIVTDLCTGCGECIKVCPVNVIKMVDKNAIIAASFSCAAMQEKDLTNEGKVLDIPIYKPNKVFDILRRNV